MQLQLEVTSFQRSSLGGDAVKVFDGLGGSIGRARTNDWVLPDPERYVSSHHAVVTYRNGNYFVTDKSTNGIYINESDDPVGNGNTVKIENGDVIQIGQYTVVATLAEDRYGDSGVPPDVDAPGQGDLLGGAGFGAAIPERDEMPGLGPDDGKIHAAEESLGWGDQQDWFRSGDQDTGDEFPQGRGSPFGGPDQGDIHAAEEKVRPTDAGWLPAKQEDPGWGGAERDHLSAHQQQMDLPNAIPEDWDMTGLNLPKLGSEKLSRAPETAPPPPPPAPPAAETPTSQTRAAPIPERAPPPAAPLPPLDQETAQTHAAPAPAPAPRAVAAGDASAALRAFFQGAGVDSAELPSESPEEYMRFLGHLFREITEGVMQILRARTGVKSSFRMQQTIIGSSENNPLKFMVSPDEAFETMFGRGRKGFMAPDQAFRASFEDIENHEMALLGGMKAAFDGLLREFNPETLEKLFETRQSGRHFLSSRKQNWELYKEFYSDVVARAQDDFQGIFGAEFVRAYEDRIDALLKARKSN